MVDIVPWWRVTEYLAEMDDCDHRVADAFLVANRQHDPADEILPIRTPVFELFEFGLCDVPQERVGLQQRREPLVG